MIRNVRIDNNNKLSIYDKKHNIREYNLNKLSTPSLDRISTILSLNTRSIYTTFIRTGFSVYFLLKF